MALLFTVVIPLKDTDALANSLDSDQNAPVGAV